MTYNEEIIRELLERAGTMLPREFSNSLTAAERRELELFEEASKTEFPAQSSSEKVKN